ncbi:MAG: hypothetical protein R2941_22670 [Desulfobacterales bacterium]
MSVYLAIALAAFTLAWVSVLIFKSRKPGPSAEELDATLVESYVQYIAKGDFASAYGKCLNADYKRDIPLSDFQKAHEKRRSEMGGIQKREIRRVRTGYNLFSPVRQHQILYALQYPGREWMGYMVLSDADGEWKIEGTYVSSASDTLTFLVW